MGRRRFMWIGLIFYFLLALVICALAFFPPARAWAHSRWQAALDRTQRRLSSAGRQLHSGASSAGSGAQQGWVSLWNAARSYAWPLTAAAALLVMVPLTAWLLRDEYRADSFDHTAAREVDERVAALLQGEQLVPPPPLPPEMFMTAEVEQWHPDARNASRQWDLLDGDFRQRLLMAFKLMSERHGYEMVLIEGYRSPERQAALAAMGNSVTLAGAGASYHQYGLAADCAFLRNGRVVISERDPWAARGYELYGEVAAAMGLTWGGAWKSLKDLGHVELRRAGVLRRAGDNRAGTGSSGQ